MGGVPVRVHWSAAVTLALVTWLLLVGQPHAGTVAERLRWPTAIAGAALFLLALLAHEAAHAWLARRNGVPVRSVTLWLLGGVAELRDEPATPGAALRIAGAGPLVSLGCGGLFAAAAAGLGAAGAPNPLTATLTWLAVANVALAVFNLLPGLPLDGGRITAALVWRHTGDRDRATASAAQAGRVVGLGLLGLGGVEVLLGAGAGGLWLALVGWFLTGSAAAEENGSTLRRTLTGHTVRDAMVPAPLCPPAAATVADLARTLTSFHHAASHSSQEHFPLLGYDRRLSGMVSLAALVTVPPANRAMTRLEILSPPLGDIVRTTPDEPLLDLMRRLPPDRPQPPAVVLDGGLVVGLVGTADILRAAQRARLGSAGTAPAPTASAA